MNQLEFEALVERIRKETTELLVSKGREYAGDADRLANFKRGAALTGVEPLTVLFIYMSKHYDALATYVRDNQAGGAMPALSEPITGRLADLINYCALAWALVQEKQGVVGKGSEGSYTTHTAPAKESETPEEPPQPRRVRVKANTGQTALLDGRMCNTFLLAYNRLPAGHDLVFEGAHITGWKYEDETDWRKC